jgi:hypothetical protein
MDPERDVSTDDPPHMDPARASHRQYLKMRRLAGDGGAPLDAIASPDLRRQVADLREWATEWCATWERLNCVPDGDQ